MVFLVLLLVFVVAALVTSGLVHEPRGWNAAMGLTAICALPLAVWTARFLMRLTQTTASKSSAVTIGVAVLPYVAVLLRLTFVRLRTPRHEPRPDDDPTLRRYLQEKRQRDRKRRQAEELLEASGDPVADQVKHQTIEN